MPEIELRYRPDNGMIAGIVAHALPEPVASALHIDGKGDGSGGVDPASCFVKISESSLADVHVKDLEIKIYAHDFPERKENLEERKNGILRALQGILEEYKWDVSVRVLVYLVPMAYGTIEKKTG